MKHKLQQLSRNSRQWWRFTKQLMHRKCKSRTCAPLKPNDGSNWVREPKEKTDLFAKTFNNKFPLPAETHELFFAYVQPRMTELNVIRSRHARKELRKLRVDQATGPDHHAAILLANLADVLDVPLAILCRRIYREASWPQRWRLHWLVPLFKKGNVYDPRNYRGIHLTSILSKVAERIIGSPLIAFLQQHGFGDAQWAFRKKTGARDLVTCTIASWIVGICPGSKIGIYLADISGAFDRVSRSLLLAKLSQHGVPDQFVDFLNSYLQPREGKVTVEGALSESLALSDMVFQGTVLGPTLWNAFCADIPESVAGSHQKVQFFDDDLNASVTRPMHMSDDLIQSELVGIQARAHIWGQRNRVTFDPSKESFHVIHPLCDDESEFNLLGVLMDSALSTCPLIDRLLKKARAKARAIARMRHMYSLEALLNQFKSHIWSFIEYCSGAIVCAKPQDRRRIDKMQRGFLYQLECDDVTAFVDYNFAPPSLRRAIAMLGFIHKRVLGSCHPLVAQVLPYSNDAAARYHTKCLVSHFDEVRGFRSSYDNSIWVFVLVYNRLPQELIDTGCVHTFQAKLNQLAKMRAKNNDPYWRDSYQSCVDVMRKFHADIG